MDSRRTRRMLDTFRRDDPTWCRYHPRALRSIKRPAGRSEGLERDDCPRVDDAGDDLHLLADEMADVDFPLHVELGEDVVIACDRINLRCNLGLRERARHLVG